MDSETPTKNEAEQRASPDRTGQVTQRPVSLFRKNGTFAYPLEDSDVYEEQVLALEDVPEPTAQAILRLALAAERQGVPRLRFLVVGAPGVGKSSLINTLLNENLCSVSAWERGTKNAQVCARQVDSVVIEFIDTPGIAPCRRSGLEASRRQVQRLRKLLDARGADEHPYLRSFHAILYVMRLDDTRPDLVDYHNWKVLMEFFGAEVLRHMMVVFTHGQSLPPDSLSYPEYVRGRRDYVYLLIERLTGPLKAVRFPVFVAENSSKCPVIEETGERKLPDDTPWITQLYDGIRRFVFPLEADLFGMETGPEDTQVLVYIYDKRRSRADERYPRSPLQALIRNPWFLRAVQFCGAMLLRSYMIRQEHERFNPKPHHPEPIIRDANNAFAVASRRANDHRLFTPSIDEDEESFFRMNGNDDFVSRLRNRPGEVDLDELDVERIESPDGRFVEYWYTEKDNPEMVRMYRLEIRDDPNEERESRQDRIPISKDQH
ncbi:similar to chloroplast outer membrane protein Toc34 [Cyanidioschyzon merolae strain 10D]|uniref:Similar to chloroplast outer membrane protein Toc34 n=1 Tax=Cyanidioschyzon merolae (strain NIES-3377 / 10D) TaxID=280699 RepID=M1V666_CYAM1|nr:similar to chloroplast outer membrane protein Toc34 [Cyanidioschyzon merolae strain 10D]BAM81885.1 similar to chloroplast outer membrane protein Toc34 [Cyanidioschyzon merolae strain 10D]|eukprot:XP_005537921.1 similar to chloroplast outer membrane protein Toc34 [Cyanidioschyzon merolae strain 10D]